MGGARCDACLVNNTGGLFPDCEECDECTDQWEARISPLRTAIVNTTSVISNLNLTNQRDIADVPELQELLQLVQEIADVLGTSEIALLSSDVLATHGEACELLNLTLPILQRARQLEEGLHTAENTSTAILSNLTTITDALLELQRELANVSAILDAFTVLSDAARLLGISRTSLERADFAAMLVRVNFTFLLAEIRLILIEDPTLVIDKDAELMARTGDLEARIDALRELVSDASARLCGNGAGNGTTCDNNCGGIGCGLCGGASGGGADGCGGLSPRAASALNTSQTALELTNPLLLDASNRLDALREVVRRAQSAFAEATRARESADELGRFAESLEAEIRRLQSELERELSRRRLDPDQIGRNINATLELQLNISLAEVGVVIRDVWCMKCCSFKF